MANDGPNCEFTHFNQLSEAFGFHFLAQTLNPVVDSKWALRSNCQIIRYFLGVKKSLLKN